MPAIRIIIFILLLIVVVTFAVQNMGLVSINYYDFKFHKQNFKVPLLIVILGSLFIGFLLAKFGGTVKQIRLRSQLKKSERVTKSLISQIEKIKPEK